MMSLSEIYLMEGLTILLVAFLQVPTGALADRIGRRKTIILGLVFQLIQITILFFATKVWHIWAENIIWAIGFSLVSGADESFLYDNLAEIGETNLYKHYQGKAISAKLFLIAFCSLSVGFLAKVNMRLPVLLSIFPVVIALFNAFKFTEPELSEEGKKKLKKEGIVMPSFIFVANHKKIKWVIGFSALVAVISKLWFFTYNPYFEMVKLPLEMYGVIFFVLNIICASSSYFAHFLSERLSDKQSIVFILAGITLPIIAMGFWPSMIMAWLVILPNFGRGYYKPFTEHIIHEEISENRATVVSIGSSVYHLVSALGLLIFSKAVLINFTLTGSLVILGTTSTILGAIFYYMFGKIFKHD
jgi:MFS family permease